MNIRHPLFFEHHSPFHHFRGAYNTDMTTKFAGTYWRRRRHVPMNSYQKIRRFQLHESFRAVMNKIIQEPFYHESEVPGDFNF